MRNSFLKATAVFLCLSILTGIGTVTAFSEETHCTIYSDTDFHCKFEISAPSVVNAGDEFEMCFRWSEYTFSSYVSVFALRFSFDTRYVVLESATGNAVTIVGSEMYWTDGSNYGEGKGLGAIEATDKSTASRQTVTLGFYNDYGEVCLEDEFIVKLKFKAVYAGDPAFDWVYVELFDELFEYDVYSEMNDASITIRVIDDESNTVPKVPSKGDVNGDGRSDNLDAAWVLKHNAKLITIADECLNNADVNDDGEVNSLDAALILRYDAGLIETL